ncbi:MAG: 4Fe-4S dicluster domain-containing protein [candidate division KSB1 bacterium]|nr:4Fe-4S dicluster domain-containing protein [candidate division KSB1 bacterium]
MRIVTLPKDNLVPFLESTKAFGELHAPLRRGEESCALGKVDNAADIQVGCLRTILPPKKYFMPQEQTMFSFSPEGYEPVAEEAGKRYVLFGLHPCDIHGLKILDLVFSGKYTDPYFFERRKHVAIIGLDCIPDEYCFCDSMGTSFAEDGFDLFLNDIGDRYLVMVGTSLGDDMVNASARLFGEVDEAAKEEFKRRSNTRREHFAVEVETWGLPEIFDMEYESPLWREAGERCLSCGACSMVCPTCYCYDVLDLLELNAEKGVRKRRWDSCLFKDYALVAGGHNFRKERSSRVKNRFFHKQRGFVAEYGRPACTGCGRCIVDCPAQINIVELITKLRSYSHV